jgi:TolB-like protein/cytochrome c-type biogenesis protein CcmH/NrfG
VATAKHSSINFGAFSLDLATKELRHRSSYVSVPPKELELLVLLAREPGRILGKRQLIETVWPGVYVEEGNLARHISFLRQRLSTFEPGADFIETIPKRGYRFRLEPAPATLDKTGDATVREMLVVLPFENLSADGSKDYFSDGFTEEMITNLSRWNPERLGVIARTTAMRYKRTQKTIGEIGAELRVSHVLEGSIRWDTDRVRVTAQLIQVHDQTHLWAETYDRKLSDIFAVQSEVTSAIAREIQVKLDPATKTAQVRPVSPEAYDAYLRGRHFWTLRTEEGMRRGIAHFEEALRLQPGLAVAHAGIADSYVMLACRGICAVTDSFRQARVAAYKALELDPHLGDAHATLAHLRLHEFDWNGLDEAFRGALQRNPSLAIAYYWYGEYLMAVGRGEEAVEVTERALRIDPLSPVIGSSMGMILYLAHDFERAERVLRRALELHPEHFLPHLKLGLVLVQLRRDQEAVASLQRAIALSDNSTESAAAMGLAYAASGDRERMEAIIQALQNQNTDRYVLPYNIAKIYAAAGEPEQAFRWLETAHREANCDLIELGSEPVFVLMRGDPRFVSLLRRVGL